MKKRNVKSFLGDSESTRKKKMMKKKEISEIGDLEHDKKKKSKKKSADGDTDTTEMKISYRDSEIPKKMKKTKKEKMNKENVFQMNSKEKIREKLLDGDSGIPKKKKDRILDEDPDISKKKKKKKKAKKNGDKSMKISNSKERTLMSRSVKQSGEDKIGTKEEPVTEISSVDEDCSKGMKKWIMDYHQKRPGLDVIQERINDFIASYEANLEQTRREREARAAEDGWTVVVHQKGRKKTTDSESGVAVGSISQAAIEARMAKKKREDLTSDFYRFQKREAQRNELMMLQSKFEHDKKRLQQLRAARKFRPY